MLSTLHSASSAQKQADMHFVVSALWLWTGNCGVKLGFYILHEKETVKADIGADE
jgi:hypothetical protein